MVKSLEVFGLSKKLKNFSLNDLSFSISVGEVTGFIGRNGSGKTTAIKCILNLLTYDGEVLFFGKNSLKHEKEYKDKIAVVFDELPFDENLNAKELSAILKFIYSKWSDKTFRDYLLKFKLPVNKKFCKFSKGMKMKLSLAVALSHDAQLLILDEPTSGLDPLFRSELLNELKTFVGDKTKAVFFSTHITSDLDQVADHLIFIDEGTIVFQGKKEKLLRELQFENMDEDSWPTIEEIMLIFCQDRVKE